MVEIIVERSEKGKRERDLHFFIYQELVSGGGGGGMLEEWG